MVTNVVGMALYADLLRRNHRLAQPYAGRSRLSDRAELLAEAAARDDSPP